MTKGAPNYIAQRITNHFLTGNTYGIAAGIFIDAGLKSCYAHDYIHGVAQIGLAGSLFLFEGVRQKYASFEKLFEFGHRRVAYGSRSAELAIKYVPAVLSTAAGTAVSLALLNSQNFKF